VWSIMEIDNVVMSKKRRTNQAPKRRNAGAKRTKSPYPASFDARSGMRIGRFSGTGFPDRLEMSLKYSQRILLTGSASPGSQVFRLNSLHDPDQTGTGHQPLDYDQVTLIYNQYCVTHATVNFQLFNGASPAARVVIAVSDRDTSANVFDDVSEGTYAVPHILGSNVSGSSAWSFTRKINLSQVLGQRRIDSDPYLYANVGSNPVDGVYCWISAQALDLASSISVYGQVTITYHASFKERQDPTQSLLRMHELLTFKNSELRKALGERALKVQQETLGKLNLGTVPSSPMR